MLGYSINDLQNLPRVDLLLQAFKTCFSQVNSCMWTLFPIELYLGGEILSRTQ